MNDLPNPDLIYDLFGGIFKPQFIRIALLLDVFTPLARPSTAEQIAQACQGDQSPSKPWSIISAPEDSVRMT